MSRWDIEEELVLLCPPQRGRSRARVPIAPQGAAIFFLLSELFLQLLKSLLL